MSRKSQITLQMACSAWQVHVCKSLSPHVVPFFGEWPVLPTLLVGLVFHWGANSMSSLGSCVIFHRGPLDTTMSLPTRLQGTWT